MYPLHGSDAEHLCEEAIELFYALISKPYGAKEYEFLISAIIFGDKKIKDLKTGYYCHYTEVITCKHLDFYITYKCPNGYVYIFDEFQRLENTGGSKVGYDGQPLGTK